VERLAPCMFVTRHTHTSCVPADGDASVTVDMADVEDATSTLARCPL